MGATVKDSFLDLERHRQLLEDNVEKLRKSLRHWQTWEAEYEGLKEEILAADPPPTRAQLVALTRDYEGDLVNKKEIGEILGPASRSVAQVVNILDRRLDYVEQNVRTVQKQVEVAENKLAAASIISTPDVRNEEGLPLTDIIEELDEEGNIISSHTSTPGSAKPQLLEVLRKAGVKDLPSLESASGSNAPLAAKETKATESKESPGPELPKSVKKGVKFAEDTKPGPETEKSTTAKRIEQIMSIAKQSETPSTEPPIIPKDESLEDAELRQEMLQYGMSEVGAVVAELDLEDGSDWSGEEHDDDSSTDDEDEFGRSTGSVMDDELRRRMIELEEKLGARVMENIGSNDSNIEYVREGIGRVTINRQDAVTSKGSSDKVNDGQKDIVSTGTKKAVRFSEELDISPLPQQPPAITPATKSVATKPIAAPISDIVERMAPTSAEPSHPASQKKTSRFKSDRVSSSQVLNGPLSTQTSGPSLPLTPLRPSKPRPFSQPIEFTHPEEIVRTAPTGPEGRTLAAQVVERDVPLDTSLADPDELNPQLLHQEVATEYHRMRNRMIQRQGGFMKEDESEIVPFTEEEGGPKKLSRFKAARLARS